MSEVVLLPEHIGIIMDGNGRWASSKGMKRSSGHLEGLKAAKRVVKELSELGVSYVSLYVFSTENWKRTEEEISFLMQLIKSYLKKEYKFYLDNQIRVIHSGNIKALPANVKKEIEDIGKATSEFTGLTVNLLINYGGQDEILRAVNRAIKDGHKKGSLTENDISSNLDHPEIPPLDLIIRTAGEKRLSNFMIWQAAYAEFIFLDELWPDITKENIHQAIDIFKARKRKFGGY